MGELPRHLWGFCENIENQLVCIEDCKMSTAGVMKVDMPCILFPVVQNLIYDKYRFFLQDPN
jgi:hypothetical protein